MTSNAAQEPAPSGFVIRWHVIPTPEISVITAQALTEPPAPTTTQGEDETTRSGL